LNSHAGEHGRCDLSLSIKIGSDQTIRKHDG
jgi:hypothetical protein